MTPDISINPSADASTAKEPAAAHSEDALVYREILVPVDFSENSEKTVWYYTRLSSLQATMRRSIYYMCFKLHFTRHCLIKGHV